MFYSAAIYFDNCIIIPYYFYELSKPSSLDIFVLFYDPKVNSSPSLNQSESCFNYPRDLPGSSDFKIKTVVDLFREKEFYRYR